MFFSTLSSRGPPTTFPSYTHLPPEIRHAILLIYIDALLGTHPALPHPRPSPQARTLPPFHWRALHPPRFLLVSRQWHNELLAALCGAYALETFAHAPTAGGLALLPPRARPLVPAYVAVRDAAAVAGAVELLQGVRARAPGLRRVTVVLHVRDGGWAENVQLAGEAWAGRPGEAIGRLLRVFEGVEGLEYEMDLGRGGVGFNFLPGSAGSWGELQAVKARSEEREGGPGQGDFGVGRGVLRRVKVRDFEITREA